MTFQFASERDRLRAEMWFHQGVLREIQNGQLPFYGPGAPLMLRKLILEKHRAIKALHIEKNQE